MARGDTGKEPRFFAKKEAWGSILPDTRIRNNEKVKVRSPSTERGVNPEKKAGLPIHPQRSVHTKETCKWSTLYRSTMREEIKKPGLESASEKGRRFYQTKRMVRVINARDLASLRTG